VADQQETLVRLADLVERIETLHAKLYRLELGVNVKLRRN
jgi:hypothetical protein